MRLRQAATTLRLAIFLLAVFLTSATTTEDAVPTLTVAEGQMQVATTRGFVVDGWDIVATLSQMLADATALNASVTAQELATASRLERLETRIEAQTANISSLHMLATSLQANLTAAAEREAQLEAKVQSLTEQLATALNHQALLQERIVNLTNGTDLRLATLEQDMDATQARIVNLTNGTDLRLATLEQEVDAAAGTAAGALYNISFLQETIKTFDGELERIDEALEQVEAGANIEEVFIDAGSGYAQLYDNDTWHAMQLSVALPTSPAVTVWRNRLVAAGGSGSSAVFAISATGFVSRLLSLPIIITGAAAATFQDKIYVVGGGPHNDNGQNRLRSVYIYDGVSWTAGPPLNGPGRSGLSCATFQDELVCVGGFYYINDNVRWGSVSTVEIFNGVSWRYGQNLPRPAASIGLVAYQNSLYIFGGLDHENSYSYFDSILRMDDLNSGWTQLALTLSTPRAINSAAVFGGEVYLVGGANGPSDNTGLLRIVESFNGTALTPRPDLIYATFLNEGGVLKTAVFA